LGDRIESLAGRMGDSSRDAEDRARIADVAARLIAEHGIADWSLAKRKALRQLMLPDRTALPGDD
jgi:phage tail protein X